MDLDITGIEIETNRLILKPIKKDDLEDLYNISSDDEVSKMAGTKTHKSIEDTKIAMEKYLDEKNIYSIFLKNENRMIGTIGVHKPKEFVVDKIKEEFNVNCGIELGFVLSKNFWGHGYMPEAVNSIMDYYFENSKCEYFIAAHNMTNIQSKKVQEKCGMIPVYNLRTKDKEGREQIVIFNFVTKEMYNDRIAKR